jgi:AbrB family looped-hinge helix DNA binding protein
LYKVRVKRKGQVTVPVSLREKMNIAEGSVMEVKEHPEGILLKPLPGIKVGKVVGKKKYKKIIGELEKLRKQWR